MIRLSTIVLFFAATTVSSSALATQENILKKEGCNGCHDLIGPAAQTADELWQRKAPDLFYAGVKYKREWLTSWLAKPTRIRPMGYHYFNHIKVGPKHDVIDQSTLLIHPVLTTPQAELASGALMKLKLTPVSATKDSFNNSTISINFGEMVFDKFNGCMGCHQIEPGYGGLSGPEVYTAANRLQEDYLVSFIRSPQAWNPKSPMPNRNIKPTNIQKLVAYLVALSKENWNEAP